MLFIFDVDGTLLSLDGLEDHAQAKLTAAREVWGLEAGMEDYLALPPYGLTDRMIVSELTAQAGLPMPTSFQLDEWSRRVVELYMRSAGVLADRVIPGVREGLSELQEQGHQMVLGTGNIESVARIKIERSGLMGFFALGGGFGSDAYLRHELIGVACGRARVSPSQAVYVGDTPLDVSSARQAGVFSVGVTTGPFGAEELGQADLLVDSLADLPAHFAEVDAADYLAR